MRVKMISRDTTRELEDVVNNWLETNENNISILQLNVTTNPTSGWKICTIQYETNPQNIFSRVRGIGSAIPG
jgi:hypothetical protein